MVKSKSKMKTRRGESIEVRCTSEDGATRGRHWFTRTSTSTNANGDESTQRPFCARCGAVNPRWPQSKCAAILKGGVACGRGKGKEHGKIKSHEFTATTAEAQVA